MKVDSFRNFVLDQLSDLEAITCLAMFGGYGLYLGKNFFGIVFKGRLYFKTDEVSRIEYERRGMKPFQPNDRQTMKYHEVPPDVIESRDEVLVWAQQAIQIARHAK